MPTARDALLDAAFAVLADLPWPAVRMVEVAAVAGVSRQTLYNEFGSKEGLARALVRHETDAYLRGVERVLAERTDPVDRFLSLTEWTVREARAKPLLRALLTGCWTERLPAPRPARPRARVAAAPPAQRRADEGPPEPGQLVAAVRDRLRAAAGPGMDRDACELLVRLALSYVVAPQWEEPDSWRPMTPTITSVIEMIFSVDTRSPRKIMP
ncbi:MULTISPECIES: TetR/AcrR family transcriptional regulator [unclassified Streptomyces]|uniref:TetR/AcrR family transcriptional regulator n=1 Tax=unclassified Streptomyces TaxID=2593676 RepID=UPI0033A88284